VFLLNYTSLTDNGTQRLSYDAAISKVDKMKASKKEKDRNEAEDELQTARLR
jgi:SWI/SNF-related matrix-associated actin-dependent regulator of chromatin subfamily D